MGIRQAWLYLLPLPLLAALLVIPVVEAVEPAAVDPILPVPPPPVPAALFELAEVLLKKFMTIFGIYGPPPTHRPLPVPVKGKQDAECSMMGNARFDRFPGSSFSLRNSQRTTRKKKNTRNRVLRNFLLNNSIFKRRSNLGSLLFLLVQFSPKKMSLCFSFDRKTLNLYFFAGKRFCGRQYTFLNLMFRMELRKSQVDLG